MDYHSLTHSCLICHRLIGGHSLPCGHLFHPECLIGDRGQRLSRPVCVIKHLPCKICIEPMHVQQDLHWLSCGCIMQDECILPQFTRAGIVNCPICQRRMTQDDRKTGGIPIQELATAAINALRFPRKTGESLVQGNLHGRRLHNLHRAVVKTN